MSRWGTTFGLVARELRGDHTESWHLGAVAAVTPDGRLVARLGDPELATFLRSAAKPFQALPLVMAGGIERFELSEADLALICASHAGCPEHTTRVSDLLERGGFTAEDLVCGTHRPYDRGCAARLREAGEEPNTLHNNCSGKHAGMLLACRQLELPTSGYAEAEHPLQERIEREMALWAGLGDQRIPTAADGCGVPAFRKTLRSLARAYAALVDPEAAGIDGQRAGAAAKVVHAMTSQPRMVAGEGRFTTRLMEVTGGRVLGKEGAAGLYAVAVRGPVALGVVVKLAHGDGSSREGVVVDVLRQLGVLSGEEVSQLAEFHRPVLKNCTGAVVGEVVPDVELETEA